MPKKIIYSQLEVNNDIIINGVDTTCAIECDCGYTVYWIDNLKIIRCPNCGKGYRTEFAVYQYEANEEQK